jgi:hypothetical protein
VARLQLGHGGRRGLIGRSRCPTRRCTGRSPRASARNTKAHGGLGRQCIIDLPFRASPVNGKTLDNRGRDLGWMEFWRRRPSPLGRNCVVARLRFSRLWRRLDWFCAECGWQ